MTSEEAFTYRLNENVFLSIQDGIAQLLDFNRGEFYGLDPMATVMVSLVLERGIEETIIQITKTYEVNEDRVRTDLIKLLENLEQKHLIITQKKHRNFYLQWFHCLKKKVGKFLNAVLLLFLKRVSSIFHSLLDNEQTPSHQTVELLLTLSWLSFRLLGWSRTISLWQHWDRRVEGNNTSDCGEEIEKVDLLVREAAAWKLFLPMVCKERALVGYHILRTFYGLPATLVVGCDRYPFQIHAWVECEGQIITDDSEHCETFIPVVRYS